MFKYTKRLWVTPLALWHRRNLHAEQRGNCTGKHLRRQRYEFTLKKALNPAISEVEGPASFLCNGYGK